MSAAAVHVTIDGPVATITVDNPGQRNAVTMAMYDQMCVACDRIDDDPAIRAVILTGQGETFIAGTAISEFSAFHRAEDGVAYEAHIEAVLQRFERLRVPVVAAIDGSATGGGLLLAAVCDLRIATRRAKFGAPIARTVGNTLSIANLRRLCREAGTGPIRAMLLLGTLMEAEAALGTGFVLELVPADHLQARAAELAGMIAANAPLTLRATREALRRSRDGDFHDDDLIREVYGSDDFKEGVAAFLAKRHPKWHGR